MRRPRPRRRPAARRARGRPRRARRRRRPRRSRWARRRTRRPRRGSASSASSSASGVRQWAIPSSGSISGATNRGRRPESTSPSMIEEWTLRCTTTRSPTWARAMQTRVVAARGAVDQEPAALRAPGLGGEPLGELERRLGRVGADVDALDPGRDVEPQRRLAERLAQRRVGARPALVAGDVEAARVAVGVGDERVEVGRRGPGPSARHGSSALGRRRRSRAASRARRAAATLCASPWTTTSLEVPRPHTPGPLTQRDRALPRPAGPARAPQRAVRRRRVRARAHPQGRIEALAKEGEAGAEEALEQLDRIDEYLAACQVGITLASIGIGFLGEPAIADADRAAARAVGTGSPRRSPSRSRSRSPPRCTSRSASRCRRCSRSTAPSRSRGRSRGRWTVPHAERARSPAR